MTEQQEIRLAAMSALTTVVETAGLKMTPGEFVMNLEIFTNYIDGGKEAVAETLASMGMESAQRLVAMRKAREAAEQPAQPGTEQTTAAPTGEPSLQDVFNLPFPVTEIDANDPDMKAKIDAALGAAIRGEGGAFAIKMDGGKGGMEAFMQQLRQAVTERGGCGDPRCTSCNPETATRH